MGSLAWDDVEEDGKPLDDAEAKRVTASGPRALGVVVAGGGAWVAVLSAPLGLPVGDPDASPVTLHAPSHASY